MPLLGGELGGRIVTCPRASNRAALAEATEQTIEAEGRASEPRAQVPSKCTWLVREGNNIGSIKVDEIVLDLVKETKGAMWRGLIRKAYT